MNLMVVTDMRSDWPEFKNYKDTRCRDYQFGPIRLYKFIL